MAAFQVFDQICIDSDDDDMYDGGSGDPRVMATICTTPDQEEPRNPLESDEPLFKHQFGSPETHAKIMRCMFVEEPVFIGRGRSIDDKASHVQSTTRWLRPRATAGCIVAPDNRLHTHMRGEDESRVFSTPACQPQHATAEPTLSKNTPHDVGVPCASSSYSYSSSSSSSASGIDMCTAAKKPERRCPGPKKKKYKRTVYTDHIKALMNEAIADKLANPDDWICVGSPHMTKFMPKVVALASATGLNGRQIRDYMHNFARRVKQTDAP